MDNITCIIKEEVLKFHFDEGNQDINVTIEGGGNIDNVEELIHQYADMLKSIYDTDDDGIVDAANIVSDGGVNISTASQIKEIVTKGIKSVASGNWKKVTSIEYNSITGQIRVSYEG